MSAPWSDPERALFSISVAAELSGLHPQTLRTYEREGLVEPARSNGGTRRYSASDIDRLQAICQLTADGLNLAGVRRVLELQQETRDLRDELARVKDAGGPGRGMTSPAPPVTPRGAGQRGSAGPRRPAP